MCCFEPQVDGVSLVDVLKMVSKYDWRGGESKGYNGDGALCLYTTFLKFHLKKCSANAVINRRRAQIGGQ